MAFIIGNPSFHTSTPMPLHARVKVKVAATDPATVELSGADDQSIGVAMDIVHTAEQGVAVRLWNSTGTFSTIAAKAISTGSLLYPAADGKVTDTAGALPAIGVAVSHATAADVIISMVKL